MESEKVKVIKEYLRCMRGEKACWDCGLNEIAENQDTCCINLVADMALDLINELESENESCYEVLSDQKAIIKQQNDRIAELEKENTKYNQKLTTNQWVQEIRKEALKQFAEMLKEKLEEYRLENEYFIKDEPNGNLWQLNASVFCIEVTQDGGLVDETLKEFIDERIKGQ